MSTVSNCALSLFFFFNDTATTEIYTLSLHDALPIWRAARRAARPGGPRRAQASRPPALFAGARLPVARRRSRELALDGLDRKSTRLNSSHGYISYAVLFLEKKNSRVI